MPHLTTDDDVKLYYEDTGSGSAVVFVHEFAGDYRSWEPQVRHFARRYRCIVFNARGWPPSAVPPDVAAYSQARARDDIKCVLDHLKIEKAHVAGLSMGGFATLHFGLTYPGRAHSLVVAGVGYGAEKDQRERFRDEAVVIAGKLEKEDMAAFAEAYAYGPTRVQFENKDPRGFAEFKRQLAEHSAKGAAASSASARRSSIWSRSWRSSKCPP
jgi:pimeloyl-ACP methyl ester carboxylesterase